MMIFERKSISNYVALFLFTLLFGFTACKKDKPEQEKEPGDGTAAAVIKTGENTFNFKSAKDSSIAIMAYNKAEDNHIFSLILHDDHTGAILEMMILPAKNGTGNYSLTGVNDDYLAFASLMLNGRKSKAADIYNIVYVDHQGEVTQSSGTLNITSVTTNRVKGNFNATLHSYNHNTKAMKQSAIANGNFDVPLVRIDYNEP